MKKLCRTTILSVWMILLFCACGSAAKTQSSTKTREEEGSASSTLVSTETPYIGLLLESLSDPYSLLIKAGAEDEADSLGAEVMVIAPDNADDAEAQANMLTTMAGMSMNVLAVAPVDAMTLQEGLALAVENGKIVMALDTDLNFADCGSFISTDNDSAAYELGTYAARLVGSGGTGAAILCGANDDVTSVRMSALGDALRAGGVSVVAATVGVTSDMAQVRTANLLMNYPDLKLICATSSEAALGAQAAVEASGADVTIVSFGASTEVAALVESGEIAAALAQNPYEIGRLCVQNAVDLYQGRVVQYTTYAETTLVTQDNAAAYIETLNNELTHQATK